MLGNSTEKDSTYCGKLLLTCESPVWVTQGKSHFSRILQRCKMYDTDGNYSALLGTGEVSLGILFFWPLNYKKVVDNRNPEYGNKKYLEALKISHKGKTGKKIVLKRQRKSR